MKISDLVSAEWMQLLSALAADELFEFRRRSVSDGTPPQLTIGAEAIEGIEAILLGIARGDLDLITLRSGQLIQGLLHGMGEAPRYSPNELVTPHGATHNEQERAGMPTSAREGPVAERRLPLVRDRPFIDQSAFTGRWYFVDSWRPAGDHGREAHTKHDITDAINRIIVGHGGDPSTAAHSAPQGGRRDVATPATVRDPSPEESTP